MAKIVEPSAMTARRRVRTPGKHIVLFAVATTLMLALSTAALRTGTSALESHRTSNLSHPGDGRFYAPKETFLADLSPDANGRIAYIKLSATIVASDQRTLAEIKAKRPQIRERLSFFLRELSPEDFDGSEAQARVKAEMLKRARLPLSEGAARDLIIDELVIQ